MGTAENLLGDEVMSLLPAALRHRLTEPKWWEDEIQGLHVVRALTALALPASCDGHRLVDNPPSPHWDWQGHALVHKSSLPHTGVNLFGPVLIGPDREIGPNASIFGPTVIEGRSYLGPSVEIRRCLLLAQAEVSHMSFLGHSVIGRRAALGAFFCSAVRNLRRGTVHVIRDGTLADTGERRLGCVIADDVETGVRTTVMPAVPVAGDGLEGPGDFRDARMEWDGQTVPEIVTNRDGPEDRRVAFADDYGGKIELSTQQLRNLITLLVSGQFWTITGL